jgi:hypothetical protein
MYTPFHPAWYWQPPIVYGGGVYPGGFDLGHFLIALIVVAVVVAVIVHLLRRSGGPGAASGGRRKAVRFTEI